MSYILDALRKSESERHRGKVPDLGQSVQMIHRPRKQRRLTPVVWVALALLVNAGVLAAVYWPRLQPQPQPQPAVTPADAAPQAAASDSAASSAQTASARTPDARPAASVEASEQGVAPAPSDRERSEPAGFIAPEQAAPTIIVPAPRRAPTSSGMTAAINSDTVPHLVELPLSFQKRVPNLIFNSHIYSSDPQARRVMINGQYLRTGDRFDGLTVERITEDGVVLSRDGQRFRVGAMRDWVSPR